MVIYKSSEHFKEILEKIYKTSEFEITKANYENFWTVKSYIDKFGCEISDTEKKKLDRTNYWVITKKTVEEWIKRIDPTDTKYEMIMTRLCTNYDSLSEKDQKEALLFMETSEHMWRRVNNSWIII